MRVVLARKIVTVWITIRRITIKDNVFHVQFAETGSPIYHFICLFICYRFFPQASRLISLAETLFFLVTSCFFYTNLSNLQGAINFSCFVRVLAMTMTMTMTMTMLSGALRYWCERCERQRNWGNLPQPKVSASRLCQWPRVVASLRIKKSSVSQDSKHPELDTPRSCP